MRLALATLPLVLATLPIATAAEDRFAAATPLHAATWSVELDVQPRRGGWQIRWTASDPSRPRRRARLRVHDDGRDWAAQRWGGRPGGRDRGRGMAREAVRNFRHRGRKGVVVVELGGVPGHRAEGRLCGVRRRVTAFDPSSPFGGVRWEPESGRSAVRVTTPRSLRPSAPKSATSQGGASRL